MIFTFKHLPMLLVAALLLLVATDCEREERQAELEAIKEQIQEKEQEDGETKENEQKYKAALEKSSDLCKGVKWLFGQKAVSEPEGDDNYEYIRERCLDSLEHYSREACGDNYVDCRSFTAFVLREDLDEGYACQVSCRRYDLDKFRELCRREAIKSGREHDPAHPKMWIYKCRMVLRPGPGVTEDDLAPLMVAAMQGIYRVAILPPLTPEEKKELFGPADPQDDPDFPEVLEPERDK